MAAKHGHVSPMFPSLRKLKRLNPAPRTTLWTTLQSTKFLLRGRKIQEVYQFCLYDHNCMKNKGSDTVIIDRDWYINECLRQLNGTKFYRRLDTDITSDILTRVQFFIKRLHKDGVIDDKTKRFLIQADHKPGRFYILPKIHKHGNPGRPIVSSNGHPTERISQFVNYYLKPLVHKTASFIKDTTHFLNKLNQPVEALIFFFFFFSGFFFPID